jgi:hypothetical protein
MVVDVVVVVNPATGFKRRYAANVTNALEAAGIID